MDSQDQAVLLIIRGVVASMPEEDQQKIKDCAEKLRVVISEYADNDNGKVALALVGAESQ